MKYLSIDIETTGLDVNRCQVLSIGIVIEDTNKKIPIDSLPTFHCGIVRHSFSFGELFALDLNRDLIQTINKWNEADSSNKKIIEQQTGMVFCEESDVCILIREFLKKHDVVTKGDNQITHLTVAGKNFGTFDKLFLENLPRWKQYFKIRQRIIDPSVLFVDWFNDESLPSLSLCKERAGFNKHVSHDAVDDAKDVIRLLRNGYYN